MTSPAPMTAAAALMNGCLRASRPSGRRFPGRPPRPGFLFSLAMSALSGARVPFHLHARGSQTSSATS
jgi:hypothetical protein